MPCRSLLSLAVVILLDGCGAGQPEKSPGEPSPHRRPGRPAARGPQTGAAGKAVLAAADITYLGYYNVNLAPLGLDNPNVGGLAHHHVGGQLRFLTVGPESLGNNLYEFALGKGGFGSRIVNTTNSWKGSRVWRHNSNGLQGCFFGLWVERRAGGGERLWQCFGLDYPGAPYQSATSAVAVCALNPNGTVSGWKGVWGFQGVSQRCVRGRVQPVPVWFQKRYGVGPYLYGFGGYNSLMVQGGTVSLGLFALAGPDVTRYAHPASWMAGNKNVGSDWSVPSSAFHILADHRTGATQGDINTATGDRGWHLAPVANYYDGGAQPDNFSGTGTAAFTKGSTTVTFSRAQRIRAGSWVGPLNGKDKDALTVCGLPSQTLVRDVNGTSGTLRAAYTRGSCTDDFILCTQPPARPAGGAWRSPGPDGKNRWVWNDDYSCSANWVDGPRKSGLVLVGRFATGKAWYHKPGNFNDSDGIANEIHVFNPADLGAVKKGTKKAWNVQPSSMKDLKADLKAAGMASNGKPNFAGATYDAISGRLYLLYCGVGGTYNDVLLVYKVKS